MSFIDNFLEVTNNLPRKIVRLLKLHRTVEQKSKLINDNLKKLREKYLKNLKDKNENDVDILHDNDQRYKELLNLSDYKQSLIEELKYILENEFVKKITPIIKEGEKECPEQQSSISVQFGNNSNYNKTTMEEKNISINNDKKKNDKLLGNKTNRLKKITRKGLARIENTEDMNYNAEEDNEIHCICHGTSYGPMIMCEICEEWFHYSCVGIQEGKEPENFYCAECLTKMESNNDNKTNNLENSNHNANNKTKKKDKNNKKKKYNQK